MLEENFPYGMVSRVNDHNRLSLLFMQACYMADDKALAEKVGKSVRKDLQQQMIYYDALTDQKAANLDYEKSVTQNLLDQMNQIEQVYNPTTSSPEKNNGILKSDSGLQQATDTTKH